MNTASTTADNAHTAATDPRTCLSDLATLSWSISAEVRAAVAANPNASIGLLRELLSDEDVTVAFTAESALALRTEVDIHSKNARRARCLDRRMNMLISDLLAA